MDAQVMELRLKQWMPIFEEQAKSGLTKQDWCDQNGISRNMFFKWQRECRKYLIEKSSDRNRIGPTDEPVFVELPQAMASDEYWSPEPTQRTLPIESVYSSYSTICIQHGSFSVTLEGDVNERQLTSVLKVISHV